MSWKNLSTDYLTFTRKERIGLLVIVVVIIGIWIFPKIVVSGKSKAVRDDTLWMAAAQKLLIKQEHGEAQSKNNEESADPLDYAKPSDDYLTRPASQLFYFDPNTLSVDGWRKLGIRQKIAITIQKYLVKGGHFYKPDDLKKIYGIHSHDYERLKPFIKIEPVKKNAESYSKIFKNVESSSNIKYSVIEVNTADTSAFISLPGIGSKLASRIVNFRDKLGGFYSIDQVAETYGLADSTFQKIKPLLKLGNLSLKKFNINTATKDEMKSHPYIKWNIANAIVEYRNQHGTFSALEELKKISLITDETFDKIKVYLTL
jgi:competence ComEA-like helix-hairpin-helix protein